MRESNGEMTRVKPLSTTAGNCTQPHQMIGIMGLRYEEEEEGEEVVLYMPEPANKAGCHILHVWQEKHEHHRWCRPRQ